MKVIFLDFDGVMGTVYYEHILSKEGLPGNDSFGTVFDPNCVENLKRIVDATGAVIAYHHTRQNGCAILCECTDDDSENYLRIFS